MLLRLDTQWVDATTLRLGSQWVPEIQIVSGYERSSVDASQSYVTTDTDDALLVVLSARMQPLAQYAGVRWLEPTCKLTGVNGLSPRIEIVPFENGGFNNGANHQEWNNSNQRGHFSYDGETWQPFSTLYSRSGSGRLRWAHNEPFSQDEVWIARSWPFSVTQCGQWIEGLAAAHPTKIGPAPSAVSFTPSLTTSFPAQSYIAGEVTAKTDEIGRAIPATPFYAFEINDAAYSPTHCALITMGVHSGEDVGEVVGRALVEYLLGSSAEAVAIRSKFRIRVYPLINPSGRWAGYYRGAPGSDVDTNRDFTTTPAHESTVITKAVVEGDLDGETLWWSFDVHASPDGGRMQTGARTLVPSTVAFHDAAVARYPAGDWSVYGDVNSDPPFTAGRVGHYLGVTVGSTMQMLLETCDRPGPISPSVMEPYAAALGGALYDLDQAEWFSNAAVPTLSAPTVTDITATTATPRVTLTNAAAGTLYYAIYPAAASEPTWNGSWSGTPVASGSEASITSDGTQTFASPATGLDPSTSYRIAFVWDDGTDTSDVAWSGAWETLATLARPVATVSVGAWLPLSGSDLHAMLNHEVADLDTHIYATEPTITRLELGNVSLPELAARALKYYAGGTNGGLKVRLYEGVTMIAERTHATLPATPTQYTMTLTEGELTALTDGTDMFVELEAIA